jgi:hypothetical protein
MPNTVWCVSYQALRLSLHSDLDYGSCCLPDLRKRLMASVISQQGMVTPRHLMPSLVYPQVRVCPLLWFVHPTGLVRSMTVRYLCHFMEQAYLFNNGQPWGWETQYRWHPSKPRKCPNFPILTLINIPSVIFQRGILFLPRTMLWHLHFHTLGLTYERQWLEEVRLTANDDAYAAWSVSQSCSSKKKAWLSQKYLVSVVLKFKTSSVAKVLQSTILLFKKVTSRGSSHYVAMVRHVTDKVREIVSYLNENYNPVINVEQLIHARVVVAKQVQ